MSLFDNLKYRDDVLNLQKKFNLDTVILITVSEKEMTLTCGGNPKHAAHIPALLADLAVKVAGDMAKMQKGSEPKDELDRAHLN